MLRRRFMTQTVAVLRLIRMSLSGAIAGVALFGMIAPAFGVPMAGFEAMVIDVAGAGVGAVAVLTFKASHVI